MRPPPSVREAGEGLGNIAWNLANPAPETPLNVPIGPHRRVLWLAFPLEELKEIKNALGGTVNDVFLAVVSGALGRWLRRHGVRTEGLELRAIVPVSIRGDEQKGALGNRITAMLGPLPVYAQDPLERYRDRVGVDERPEGVQAGRGGGGAHAATGLRATDHPRAGIPAQLLRRARTTCW